MSLSGQTSNRSSPSCGDRNSGSGATRLTAASDGTRRPGPPMGPGRGSETLPEDLPGCVAAFHAAGRHRRLLAGAALPAFFARHWAGRRRRRSDGAHRNEERSERSEGSDLTEHRSNPHRPGRAAHIGSGTNGRQARAKAPQRMPSEPNGDATQWEGRAKAPGGAAAVAGTRACTQ